MNSICKYDFGELILIVVFCLGRERRAEQSNFNLKEYRLSYTKTLDKYVI